MNTISILLLIILVLQLISILLVSVSAGTIQANYINNNIQVKLYTVINWICIIQIVSFFIILLTISIMQEEQPQQQSKNIITNNIINMDTTKALPTITEWVHRVMSNNKQELNLEPQNFNVTPYSQEDKDIASKELEARGYKVELENNNNSMKVEIKSLFKNPIKK